jgi:ATP-binding cassette subfamily B protein
MADVNAMIFETVAGIAIAKNFRREGTVYDDFVDVNERSYRINMRRGFVLANVFPVLNCVAGVGTGVLVYFGGLATVQGAIYLGAWYLFLQSVEAFFFPLINLASFWSQVQAGLSAIERVFALIDYESTVVQIGSESVDRVEGEIRFEGVCLRYRGGAVVLPSLDLHIRPGESVALVGHTGAGKSSIARLVARFYEFQEGRLTIDGRDVRRLDLVQYRRHLGIVPQTPFLFNGTVLENIRYARPEASEAAVLEMASGIGGGEWLAALPDGLQTSVGERGTNLSMGQRQLVALARVLVQQPEIFILDEATASVDPFTEAEIQEALELILGRSTSIIIAHRLSTVRAADRILVLSEGRVIEEGSHDTLMAAGGHYAELYDTYFRHQSPDYLVEAGTPPPPPLAQT